MRKFPPAFGTSIFICTHKRQDGHPKPCCADRGGLQIRDELKEVVRQRGLEINARVFGCSCIGACDQGPMAIKYPDGKLMLGITPDDMENILDELS